MRQFTIFVLQRRVARERLDGKVVTGYLQHSAVFQTAQVSAVDFYLVVYPSRLLRL